MSEVTGCRACRPADFLVVGPRQAEGHVSVRFKHDQLGVRIWREGEEVTGNSVEAMAGDRGWTIEYHVVDVPKERGVALLGPVTRTGRHYCECWSREVQLVLRKGVRVRVARDVLTP